MNGWENNPFVVIVALALVDALFGGAVMAYLQRRGWDQFVNDMYQFLIFVVCIPVIYKLCDTWTVVQVMVLWVFFVEDVLYYWFMPLVAPLHVIMVGRYPTYDTAVVSIDPGLKVKVPFQFGFIRESYRGVLGIFMRRTFSGRMVCVMAVGASVLVWLVP